MSKDVIIDRYARLYEIPYQLAGLGHEVCGYCLSYQGAEQGSWRHEAPPGTLSWQSRSVDKVKLFTLPGYPFQLLREAKAFRPDLIVAASDIPHVVLGGWLARRLGVPFVADLYDNFEGFGQARIPGFVRAFRSAVRRAHLVFTTSEPLREMVEKQYRPEGRVIAMPSTVDTSVFCARDKQLCRQELGLPQDAILIGTAGGLLAERGIGDLYKAWEVLSQVRPEVHLVLAGPTDKLLKPPSHARVHYLGMLKHDDTAKLFCALDVGVIYLRDTPFGRYCFPQKAYEMQACRLPVVGANVGVMPRLLEEIEEVIYQAGSPSDLVRALEFQIANRKLPELVIENWQETIESMEKHLNGLLS
ncbi:glycosyltransferase family 4 protein [Pseudomonas aestusnigri]|uniref:glycosyltransferase family 4 protein n=1 Tax=Halopseudomonas aestusnigri TaxID=857252 RepID=UPI001D18CF98|nr:glycosyltransferase family 4 protein [Halopseudomonas aestusnigri]MCC4260152.1 glycosyltransferase family 4 protein [Halopseudomonas aestusnigri]